MGSDDNGDLRFEEGDGNLPSCPSVGMYAAPQTEQAAMTMSSTSLCKSSNGVDSFFGTGWDPLVSLAENVEFIDSTLTSCHSITISPYSVCNLENHGNRSTSHLVQYPSDPSLIELASRHPCFGSGSFSEMVSSFGLPECNQISNSGGVSNYPLTKEGSTRRISTNSRKMADQCAIFQEDLQLSDEVVGGLSPKGKKRKMLPEFRSGVAQSQFDSIQMEDVEKQNDVSQETLEGRKEQDEKKQKTEKNPGTNARGKLPGKQAKDSSQNGQTPNEDYIHVRARRGQATNSHSLAERVRREKISQRMRFLQDLVPGCNKITGKALMLDEIINYVQSLQRQVEFLSMKLATVNPELHIDIERVLSKDILHAQGGGTDILRFGPGMSSSHNHPHITPQGAVRTVQCADPQLPSMPQMPSVWDDELQGVIQMGFMPNTTPGSLGLSGNMKVEL